MQTGENCVLAANSKEIEETEENRFHGYTKNRQFISVFSTIASKVARCSSNGDLLLF